MVARGEFGEGFGGFGLVPVGDGGDVVAEFEVAASGAPTKGLDGDAEIFFEADRVGDVPSVEAEALLGVVEAVGRMTWGSPVQGPENSV